ncbi:MAG: RNB domain-containing ribonuclease [Lentisphaeria bacterium]|nr:RNB domain-containing ribonuclease [Lentisphaeria bacterium]
MELEGRIVDYFAGAEIELGAVSRRQRDRLQVETANGRHDKIAERQVVAVHGPAGSDPARTLNALAERIGALVAEVDTELLWSSVSGEEEALDPAALAEIYFGQSSPEGTSALARCLAADPVHFRRKGLAFYARGAAEAAEVEELRRRRGEKAALRERAQTWVSELLGRPGRETIEVPPELAEFVRQTADFLLAGHNSEAVNVLSRVPTKRSPREVALEVLTRTGNLPADADPFLLVNGIHAFFSTAVMAAAESLEPYRPDSSRTDLTSLYAFSIDDEETREVDDALSVCRDGDETVVGIHIADPAYFVQKDDPLDRVAQERPLSLYLPTTTVMMFPAPLSCGLASLCPDEVRPSLSFTVRFAADGSLKEWDFGGAQVSVRRRLSYDEADAILAAPEGALGEALTSLLRLSRGLTAQRVAVGAFTLSRPELKVRVRDGRVTVQRIDSMSPSHRLVSEWMVLANRLTAEYALRHDIPVIYRVQDPPSEPVTTLEVYDPVRFDQEVRKMKRTRLSTHPQPHTGLGLELYTQISSPIRRYADLVLARQLDAHVSGRSLPYSQQEVLEVLGNVERIASQNRSLERDARRQWLLEYLRQERSGVEMEATVVSQDGRFVLAEVGEVLERGVLFTKGAVHVGDRVRVRLRDANPKAGKLVLEMV